MVRMNCEICGRSHTSAAAMEKCAEKAQRKMEREAKKQAEEIRRASILRAEPVAEFIKRRRGREGAPWEGANGIIPALKKDYPKGTPVDIWTLFGIYAETLNWPGVSLNDKRDMLLEKYYTGEYLTRHPLLEVGSLGVMTPEQLRLATGEDIAAEEGTEIDVDN